MCGLSNEQIEALHARDPHVAFKGSFMLRRRETASAYYTEKCQSEWSLRDPYMCKPSVPALCHIYSEWNNDMRSTLGLLPHQSVGGPPPQLRWIRTGGADPSNQHMSYPSNHNSINIKCNAYESNTNTNTKAPHGMPLVNRHGHLTLTKMEAHGAERRIIYLVTRTPSIRVSRRARSSRVE